LRQRLLRGAAVYQLLLNWLQPAVHLQGLERVLLVLALLVLLVQKLLLRRVLLPQNTPLL
jgi:hypothetical protein